jgi:hypothetical protein
VPSIHRATRGIDVSGDEKGHLICRARLFLAMHRLDEKVEQDPLRGALGVDVQVGKMKEKHHACRASSLTRSCGPPACHGALGEAFWRRH